MSRSHSFSVEIASMHGVDVALMLNHFSFWYLKNKADNNQYYKGDYWVRMKAATMKEYYPYFTLRQLRYLVDKMIDLKLLKQDEFNFKKNDRTKWYCLTKESKKIMQIVSDKNVTNNSKTPKKQPLNVSDKNVTNVSHKIVTLTDKNVTSIEEDTKDRYYYYSEKIIANKSLLEVIAMQNLIDLKTVENKLPEFEMHIKSLQNNYDNDRDLFSHFSSWIRKQDLKRFKLEKEAVWFVEMFNQVSGREFLISDVIKQSFTKQFEMGFTSDQMRKSVRNLYSSSVANDWHLKSRYKFATPEYLLKDGNMNKYLNFKT